MNDRLRSEAITWKSLFGPFAIAGLAIIGLLSIAQFIAVLRPHSEWTIANVYGGSPDATDPKAYFAFNQGFAWADPFFWLPLQIGGSIGIAHAGAFFLALWRPSVPFWYSAIPIFIWNRDLGFTQNTLYYWVVVWSMFPVYGVLEGVYCFTRLL